MCLKMWIETTGMNCAGCSETANSQERRVALGAGRGPSVRPFRDCQGPTSSWDGHIQQIRDAEVQKPGDLGFILI